MLLDLILSVYRTISQTKLILCQSKSTSYLAQNMQTNTCGSDKVITTWTRQSLIFIEPDALTLGDASPPPPTTETTWPPRRAPRRDLRERAQITPRRHLCKHWLKFHEETRQKLKIKEGKHCFIFVCFFLFLEFFWSRRRHHLGLWLVIGLLLMFASNVWCVLKLLSTFPKI